MTNTIKWHYKGTEIYFVSTEDNFERHKLQNAGRLGLTDPQVTIIENGNTNNPPTTGAPCRNCGTSTKAKSTVYMEPTEIKNDGEESRGLFYMSGDVDPTDTTVDTMEDNPDSELLGGSIDRLAL